MKKSLKIVICLFLILQIKSAVSQTSYIITPDQIYINAASSAYQSVKPGDTLYFQGGSKQYLLIKGFQGAPGKPIVMINSGGPIIIDTDFYYGINIQNCRYIKFTGTGDAGTTYGFQVKRVAAGAGMSVGALSSDFEIDHVSIENTMIGGLYAKTDPDCDLTAERSNFTQYNTIIHDNYIGHAGNEGMYIGSTKYTGQDVMCNGKDTVIMPSLLDGVKVYNNLVEYAGWDGIQVSSAYNNCQIYNNTVLYDSQSEAYAQMSGIILGGGTKVDCYNNFISQGKGDGIEFHGLGGSRIFNNIIVDAGRSFLPTDLTQMRYGIYVSDNDSSLYIQHNDIINPKSEGIRFSNAILGKVNVITSNIIINPGNFNLYENGNTHFKGADSYINFQDIATVATLQNNYLALNADSVKFVSTTLLSPNDFKLLSTSPLIDQANIDPTITFDFEDSPRPHGVKSDIGAFEFGGDLTTDNDQPDLQNMTGGGSYCSGGTGVSVGLGGSQTDINYQLILNGINTGTIISGTGSEIDFGLQTAAGTYTVVGINSITSTSRTMAGSAIVTINPLPVLYTVTGGGTYCGGGPGVVVGLSGSQTGINYQLSLAGVNTGAVVAGTGSAISFGLKTLAGTYIVVATNSTNTCSSTMTGNVKITTSAAPSTPASIGGTKSVCVGNNTTLTDATTGGVWSSLNTSIATITTTGVVKGRAAGTVSITYTVTNAGGCSASSSTTVTVNALPTTPAVIGGVTSVCQGSTTTLTETTTGGVWSSSSTSIATVTTKGVVTGIAAGTATIKYTVTNASGCATSTSTAVTVNAPAATPDKFTTSTTRVSKGTANVAYTVPLVAGVIYKWSYSGTGATITGTTNSVLISFSLTATSGTLSVTATNGCGTSVARTLNISLLKGAAIPATNPDSNPVIAPSATSVDPLVEAAIVSPVDASILPSSTSPEILQVTPANNELKVFPNPTVSSTTFEFQIGNNSNVKLDIFSMAGQRIARIFDAEVEGGIIQTVYFQKSLPSGMYTCVMRWGGKMLTKKLIVRQ